MNKAQLIDLDKGQLGLLESIIKSHIPDKTVWAYGSRVAWKAGEASDLDLAVFGCSSTEIFDLKEAFEESDLLMSVDVMNWETIPEKFKENIRKKHVVLQEKQELAGWRRVKLGEISRLNYGKSLPKQKRIAKDVPVYSSAGLTGHHNKALATSKGLIIGRKGNIGSVYKSNIPFFPIDTTFYISKDDCDCDLDYLFYRLSSLGLPSLNSDSAVPGLNRNTFYAQKIMLPPLPEQKAIAEVLSSLDDKIDNLRRQNKTLEDMAQTLFRQWFIEEADESWEEGKVSNEFDFIMGQSPPGKSYNKRGSGAPLFQGSADFCFRFPQKRTCTAQSDKFAEKYDALIDTRAPVGKQNTAREKHCIGRGVAALRYKKNHSFYAYAYLKMTSLMKEIKQFKHAGAVFGSASKSDFEKLKISIPPVALIREFQQTAQPIGGRIIVNQSQIGLLEYIRDILLPKMMSGNIKV